jgi:hypothetical protein
MLNKFPGFIIGIALATVLISAPSISASAASNKKENDSTTDATTSLTNPTGETPVAATSPKSPWTGTFYYRNQIPKKIINNLTGAPTVFAFGQVGYHLTATKTVAIRQELNYQYSGDSRHPQKLTANDLFIAYVDSNLIPLKDDYSFTGVFRLYFPTGDASRFQTKQNGSEMAWFILSKSVGNLDWDVHLFNIYYNQTQNSYNDEKGATQSNPIYEIDPAFDVSYKLLPKLSISGWLQSENITNLPVDGQVRDLRHWIIEPGFVYHPIKNISISATYFDYIDTSTNSQIQLFADRDCQYRLTFIGTL